MRVFERRGRYYDEYEIGDLFRHKPGRTITEADNTLFTTLTMNTQSLHLDAEVAATSEFGQRLVNSLMTLAIAAGLSVGDTTEGTTIANLGFGEIAFPRPVFINDTLYAETEIKDKRISVSRKGQGIVTFEHRARNQRGDIVCTAQRSALVWLNEAAQTAASA